MVAAQNGIARVTQAARGSSITQTLFVANVCFSHSHVVILWTPQHGGFAVVSLDKRTSGDSDGFLVAISHLKLSQGASNGGLPPYPWFSLYPCELVSRIRRGPPERLE